MSKHLQGSKNTSDPRVKVIIKFKIDSSKSSGYFFFQYYSVGILFITYYIGKYSISDAAPVTYMRL